MSLFLEGEGPFNQIPVGQEKRVRSGDPELADGHPDDLRSPFLGADGLFHLLYDIRLEVFLAADLADAGRDVLQDGDQIAPPSVVNRDPLLDDLAAAEVTSMIGSLPDHVRRLLNPSAHRSGLFDGSYTVISNNSPGSCFNAQTA